MRKFTYDLSKVGIFLWLPTGYYRSLNMFISRFLGYYLGWQLFNFITVVDDDKKVSCRGLVLISFSIFASVLCLDCLLR